MHDIIQVEQKNTLHAAKHKAQVYYSDNKTSLHSLYYIISMALNGLDSQLDHEHRSF